MKLKKKKVKNNTKNGIMQQKEFLIGIELIIFMKLVVLIIILNLTKTELSHREHHYNHIEKQLEIVKEQLTNLN